MENTWLQQEDIFAMTTLSALLHSYSRVTHLGALLERWLLLLLAALLFLATLLV